MKKALYISLLFGLLISACEDPYFPEIENEQTIVIECALGVGEDPTVRLHLTNPILNPSESFYYPEDEDGVIDLFEAGEPSPGRVSWNGSLSLFQSTSIPIEEGVTYAITAKVEGKDVDSIYAETTVPFAVPLETVNTVSLPIRGQEGNFIRFENFHVEIEIPESIDPNTYFHLIPELKNADMASQGIIQYDQLSKQNVNVLSANSGIKQFIHKNGIFIDNSRIDDNTVELSLNFKVAVQNNEYLDSVRFTLNTINEEFMVYHENTDRELRTSVLPLDDPQISDTNIKNGYGLFGAYSSSRISIPIQ